MHNRRVAQRCKNDANWRDLIELQLQSGWIPPVALVQCHRWTREGSAARPHAPAEQFESVLDKSLTLLKQHSKTLTTSQRSPQEALTNYKLPPSDTLQNARNCAARDGRMARRLERVLRGRLRGAARARPGGAAPGATSSQPFFFFLAGEWATGQLVPTFHPSFR